VSGHRFGDPVEIRSEQHPDWRPAEYVGRADHIRGVHIVREQSPDGHPVTWQVPRADLRRAKGSAS
jgi:hypothetical protein